MSALSDKIAEVRKSLDATTNRVQTDVATLQAKIDALQGQVDAGSATQADIDALESLKQDLDKIDPATPSTV